MVNIGWGIVYRGNHILFGSEVILIPFGQVYIVINKASEEGDVIVFREFKDAAEYCLNLSAVNTEFANMIIKAYEKRPENNGG